MKRPPFRFVPEPFAYHEEVELEITDLTNLGAGVGRINDWVVMVAFTIPGERVRARIFRNHKRHSEGDLVTVLAASPDRVEPRCPLFGTCGGCQYQHLAYAAQLEWKRRQVAEILQRIGGIGVPVQPVVPSPREYGYRSKITPHYRPPRQDGPPAIGFLRVDNRGLVDVPQCPIATEAINRALPAARERVGERFQQASGKRRLRDGTLLLRDTREGVLTEMTAVATERIGDWYFTFKAGEFFQNNPFILPSLVEYVIGEAAGPGLRCLVDAYCGAGVFAICAARRFESVAGVELSQLAVAAAQENAMRNRLSNVRFLAADAARIFAGLDFPPAATAVIMDPPRRGCDESFLEQLQAYGPSRAVYVSCDPATQARDLARLAETGWRIERLQPFDLFPQTRHLECVATLVRPA